MRQEDTNYFKTDKMVACPCGCGLTITDDEFWAKLEKAREIAGVPFTITSGARCPWYNDVSKGFSKTSSHRDAIAVDIATPTSSHRYHVMRGLMLAGFQRIGYNTSKKFIHADNDKNKPREILFDY